MTDPLFDDIIQEQNAPPKRTIPVTIICIVYLVLGAMTIGQVLTRSSAKLKVALIFVIPIVLFMCWLVWAVWNMKKWAAIILIILLSLTAVRRWWSGADIAASVIAGTTVVVLATQLKKMD